MIAPDGAWLIYESLQSGQFEIYLQAFPDKGPVIQVSTAGGVAARWSRDGRRIYFWTSATPLVTGEGGAAFGGTRASHRNMTVVNFSVEGGAAVLSPPRHLFECNWVSHPSGRPNYEITADDRFLLIQREHRNVNEFRVVTNWTESREAL